LVRGQEEFLLSLTINDGDMLLPEPEEFFIILGKYTIPFIMAVNQELSQFLNSDWSTAWGFNGVLQSI
jgi:hypothetical protein